MRLDPEHQRWLSSLGDELDRRSAKHKTLDSYYEGSCPLPLAIEQARLTRAYRYLMPMAEAAWGSLVVDSVLDRLEVTGIRSDDSSTDDVLWSFWQDNCLDAESKLAHNSAFIDGRAYALVWPEDGVATNPPEVTLDDATQMVVAFREGNRRKRTAALRRWVDADKTLHATLFTPQQIVRFSAKESISTAPSWEYDGDPMPNPLGEVPVVELRVNGRLKPGPFPAACGEYEKHMGLIDRINLLTFLGLVVAFWQGFPLRGVIGERILKDDDGNVIPPFDANADSLFQLENPEAKLATFDAADRGGLSVFAELAQLAMLTKTPRHYFPQDGGISNVSADTIRADEGALNAKVTGHKASLGESWEEVCRLGGKMLGVELASRAEIVWADHESRSLAEKADAASKLKDILPMAAVAELALNATGEQIARWEADAGSSALGAMIAAMPTVPANVPAG